MNSRVLKTVLTAVTVGIFAPVLAQRNYYVVVGAFSTEGDAKELTTHLPAMDADTAYATADDEHVVHLYVMRTSNEDVAIAKSRELVLSVDNMSAENFRNYESISITPGPEGKTVSFRRGIAPLRKADLTSDASGSRASSFTESRMGAPAWNPMSSTFQFTVEAPDGRYLPAKVHLVDFDNEKELGSYESAKYVDIMKLSTYESDLAFVCAVFGYKPSERYFNYDDPALIEGAYLDENGSWIVPYKLERLTKGDVSVMYNVTFHKDAVVMLPQSITDLEELLKMMNENPDYAITIHGHCNGKESRKIIALGPQHDLFDLDDSKQVFGSAKQLTQLRAEAVKNYLVKNGVDERRIKTFAWGGRLMLADPESNNARLNDRIEIEIRKD